MSSQTKPPHKIPKHNKPITNISIRLHKRLMLSKDPQKQPYIQYTHVILKKYHFHITKHIDINPPKRTRSNILKRLRRSVHTPTKKEQQEEKSEKKYSQEKSNSRKAHCFSIFLQGCSTTRLIMSYCFSSPIPLKRNGFYTTRKRCSNQCLHILCPASPISQLSQKYISS